MSKTAQGGFYFIIVQIVGLGAGILTQRVLGTILTPVGYGAFGLIVSFTVIVSTVLTAGVPRAAARFVAVSPNKCKWIHNRILSMQGRMTALLFLVYLGFSPMIAQILLPEGELAVVLIAALMIPVESTNILYLNLLNGLKEYHKQGNSRIVYFVAKSISSISLVLAGYQLFGAVAGFVMGSGFSLLVEYVYWKGASGTARNQDSTPIEGFTSAVIGFSTPLIIYSTLNLILMSIDMFAINAFMGHYDSGIYYAAKNISLLPNQLLIGATAALFPTMSAIHERKDSENFRFYANLTMKYLFLALIPSIIFMVAFSENIILLIYGVDYISGVLTQQLLSFAFIVLVGTAFLTTLMVSTGHTRDIVLAIVVSLCAHLLGCFILIPVYGIVGAALSWILASLLGFTIMSGLLTRREGKVIPWRILGKCVVAMAPSVLAYLMLANLNIFVAFTSSILVYASLVFLMKAVSWKDIQYVVQSVVGHQASE